ncbi:MAG: hypothetical protein IH914_04340 [candidate division Zixibacteria bacterium]|nr:hypothetical protein [candidate division Zixibacteria bacterium]
MIKRNPAIILALLTVFYLVAPSAQSQTPPKIGVRAGLGTDISGGLAYGAGVNYLISFPSASLELGVILFGGSFEESTEIGSNIYDEKTDVFLFGVMANYLFNCAPNLPGTYFVAGFGLAAVEIEWEESSATDGSLGTPLPGSVSGSMQAEDGSWVGRFLTSELAGHLPAAWMSGPRFRSSLPSRPRVMPRR